ncbi:MAG: hypothetical protein AAFN07_01635 [Pseudomonadota bacterium]
MAKLLRRELVVMLVILAATLLILVPAVYWVGGNTLGPYGDSGTLGTYVSDVAGSLSGGDRGMWFFVVTPFLSISVLRLGFAWARKIS